MRARRGMALACLGGVFLGMTVVGTGHQAWALSDGPAAAVAPGDEAEKEMAAIPPLTGRPIPAANLEKILEPSEEKAAIPGRADEKPFKPFRKAAPKPEKKMATIPDEAGNATPGNDPAAKGQ